MNNLSNKPAFPKAHVVYDHEEEEITFQSLGGLTTREFFAAMAMLAIVSNCNSSPDTEETPAKWVSDQAIKHADALIAALEGNDGQA